MSIACRQFSVPAQQDGGGLIEFQPNGGSLIAFNADNQDGVLKKRHVKTIRKIASSTLGIDCSGLDSQKRYIGGHISIIPGVDNLAGDNEILSEKDLMNILKRSKDQTGLANVALVMLELKAECVIRGHTLKGIVLPTIFSRSEIPNENQLRMILGI